MYWWNCIQRRNFGLLKAYELGAEIIATIDDDNIPLKEWGKKIYINQDIEIDYYLSDNICFDPIAVTNHSNLWHRGFPLQLLSKRKYRKTKKLFNLIFKQIFGMVIQILMQYVEWNICRTVILIKNYSHFHQIPFLLLILKIHFYQET